MTIFRIACEWIFTGVMHIEAETLEKAKKCAREKAELPTDPEYLGDSFIVNDALTDYLAEEDGQDQHDEEGKVVFPVVCP